MNRKGFSITGVIFFFLFIFGAATYFSGVYQSLISMNIGDPVFFQIIGTVMVLLAVLALTKI